jgi:gentisate 1,2-dioxygenase
MDPIFQAGDCMANNVCFTPGARTFWHRHERGQILTVTLGTGLICSQGEEPQKLQVGDMVHIPASEVHWHGATSKTIMAHTAISLGSMTTAGACGLNSSDANFEAETTWLHEVKQEDYETAHNCWEAFRLGRVAG